MANVLGITTLNQTKFVELDAHPLLSATVGLDIGDVCVSDGVQGLWQKIGNGDFDFSRLDLLSTQSIQSTSAGILSLAPTSSSIQVFTGVASGQIVKLPNATNLGTCFRYEIWNTSSQDVLVQDFNGNSLSTVSTGVVLVLILSDSGVSSGVWQRVSIAPSAAGVSYGSPVGLSDSSNSDGIATSVARSDHVHSHGNRGGGTLHAPSTQSVAGFMSTTDKIKLDTLVTKSGRVLNSSFSGNPKKTTVTFATAFASTDYSVVVSGVDTRVWTIESQLNGSFVINANANQALTGDVKWQAQLNGEP